MQTHVIIRCSPVTHTVADASGIDVPAFSQSCKCRNSRARIKLFKGRWKNTKSWIILNYFLGT